MAPVTVYVQHIPEDVIPGRRLGRHIHVDSRSAAYPFTSGKRTIIPRLWARNIPILDQGNLGSCTGNAITGALGCDPAFYSLPTDHVVLDEAEAVALYSAATGLDSYPGAYPPEDTGSDGTSVCKAAQQAGLLSGYTHATDLTAMQMALQVGPVIIGINWYSSFDRPSATGLVKIASGATVRGGHEVVVRGIDPTGQLFQADNSWGDSWGLGGTFFFSYATMERLFAEQGDCVSPVPISQPAPVPVPPTPPVPPEPPAPAEADVAYWQKIQPWAKARHVGSNRAAALASQEWAKAKGFYG